MRYQFPADRDQLFYTPPANNGEPLLGSPGRAIPIYLNPSLSVVAIDITEMDGSPLTGIVTLTADSLMPDFLGPDGVDRLWINTANGPYALLPRSISRAHRATSTSEEILRSKIPTEAFPRLRMTADGSLFISDGTEDPAAASPAAIWTVRGRPNEITARFIAGNDLSLHSVLEVSDRAQAPIMSVGNVNGLLMTDDIHTDRSVFGPHGFRVDIYGFAHLLTWGITAHAGPPGNMAYYPTSSAEQFHGSRLPSIGTWVAESGSSVSVISNPYGLTNQPGESFSIRQWYKSGWGPMTGSASPGDGTSAFPCAEGNYVKAFTNLRMASAISRDFYGVLRFFDGSNALLATTIAGTPVSVDDAAWVPVPVGGYAPAGTAKVSYQFWNDDALDADTVNECGFWIGKDSRDIGSDDPNPSNVWSPGFQSQPGDGIYYGAITGAWYIRTDTPYIAGQIMYVLDGGTNWTYAPFETSCVGDVGEARWIARV